jgi:hypothetical protein
MKNSSKKNPYAENVGIDRMIGGGQPRVGVMSESVLDEEILPFITNAPLEDEKIMMGLFLKFDAGVGSSTSHTGKKVFKIIPEK